MAGSTADLARDILLNDVRAHSLTDDKRRGVTAQERATAAWRLADAFQAEEVRRAPGPPVDNCAHPDPLVGLPFTGLFDGEYVEVYCRHCGRVTSTMFEAFDQLGSKAAKLSWLADVLNFAA